jgi:transposase-like protein
VASQTFTPTAKQFDYLEAMCEPGLKQTVQRVCETAGVSRQAYYQWVQQEGFLEWLHGEYSRRRASRKPGVLNAMEQRALEGDVQAAKLYMQTGTDLEYRPSGSMELTGEGGGPVRIVIPGLTPDEEG